MNVDLGALVDGDLADGPLEGDRLVVEKHGDVVEQRTRGSVIAAGTRLSKRRTGLGNHGNQRKRERDEQCCGCERRGCSTFRLMRSVAPSVGSELHHRDHGQHDKDGDQRSD